jgi:hypothetical protein
MMRFSILGRFVCATLAVCVVSGVVGACGALAAVVPAPGWMIDSLARPGNFSTADNDQCLKSNIGELLSECDTYTVTATNAGSQATDGSEVTLTDTLPAGLTVRGIGFYYSGVPHQFGGVNFNLGQFFCNTTTVRCSIPSSIFSFFKSNVNPDGTLRMEIFVTVNEPGASGAVVNRATVSGGGAQEASASSENTLDSTPPAFGFSSFDFRIGGLDGARDALAGDHPYELTTTIDLNDEFRRDNSVPLDQSVQDIKDTVVDLPLGFVGSTLAAPQCSFSQLSSTAGCPPDTVIGHLLTEPYGLLTQINSPIYNMTPERGVPAEFAYIDAINGSHVFYVHVVPTPKGYVLQTINPDIPQVPLSRIVVTFYGDPAAKQEELARLEGRTPSPLAPVPFFTNPTDCSGEQPTASIYLDSWQHPARFNPDGSPVSLEEAAWARSESKSPPVTGCNALQFPAQIKAQPTTHESDKPSGMDFEISLPQSETMGVVATPALKKVVVTLPEGFTIDPSAGDGLAACSEAQIGWLGGTHLNFSAAPPRCPEASKIGSLELETPLVPHKFEGEMFIAEQNENPFGATLAAYVVVHDPVTGVLIKIAGEFLPDPHTGRLTAVFDENPNLPFSDLKLHFFGGPRAELATPESCGTFTVGSELTPWSAPDSGPAAMPFDSFPIDEACPGGFAPSFTAGSMNLQAGAYTSFVASFQRSDADQELAGLTINLPPGLLANLNGVPLCTDAQIQQTREGGAGCPAASQVGTVVAGAGPGPDPLFVSGRVYLTGPYNGGPYGLAAVVPAVAGPFDFGTVVVRQSLRIDPIDAHVTDVSDPFPTIIDGIPLRLRRVDVRVERPGFTFNPTNCSKLAFTGNVSGSPLGAPRMLDGIVGYATQPGASSSFTTPFQVTNCATLGFKPSFAVSTSGKTSRQNGASLDVKLAYPPGSLGKDANIRSVKVELPKQLPSRLTTLQKACPDRTFDANPAACPVESRVGTASASTPIIPVTLSGPAYFVSHGGEKFPELIIVLSGNGITVQLHGETFISKAGITSSTFRTIPDVPVQAFELTLPQGQFSALAANGDLCASALRMPTVFTAQNGLVIHRSTPIATAGCPKSKKTHKHKRHHKAKHKHRRR